MNDIALIWDPANGRADFAIVNGDIQMDAGLRTAVIVSLFCDRQADAGDAIPDGTADRRGFWGDTSVVSIDPAGIVLTGSRLWLLANALQVPATLRRAESYAREALKWLTSGGIAQSVTAAARYPGLGQINLIITITEGATLTAFDFTWSAT